MSMLRRRMMMASSVKEPDVPDTPTEELDYLTIIPLHEEEVEYFIYPYSDSHRYDVFPFYYRINKGEWVEVNLSGTSTPVFRIDLNKTKELQLKCNSVEFNPESNKIQYFSISSIGSFSLGGTPMSIIYGDDFNDYDYVPDSFLQSTFANNLGLKSIVNPETFLPYTNVSDSCYVSLFEGCTSLTNSPTLPATTLTYDCYAMMFRGCSNLKHIKMLAKEAKSTSGISIGIEDCLNDWVNGVSSTGIFVKSKDATWDVRGVNGIPEGWTVITDDYPTNSEGMPDSKEFGFPLFLNTEYLGESDYVIMMYRDVKDIMEPFASWFSQNTDGYGGVHSDVLYRDRIFIDGYIVTRMYYNQSLDALMMETQKDYGNDSSIGISSDGNLYVTIAKQQVGGAVEISFNIDGRDHTAAKGMTWKQWVQSSYYNPSYGENKIYIVENTVYLYAYTGDWFLIGQNGSDIIVEGTRYELYGPVPAPEL